MSAMSWSSGTMIDAGALISAIAEGDGLNSEWLVESILREGRAREAICALLCNGGDECTSMAAGTTLASLLAAIHQAAMAHPETVEQPTPTPIA